MFSVILNSFQTFIRKTKTQQFALPESCSNSGVKMLRYSAIKIWSEIPLDIKEKPCLILFTAEYRKRCYPVLEALLEFIFVVH